jgi:hypothetical protein
VLRAQKLEVASEVFLPVEPNPGGPVEAMMRRTTPLNTVELEVVGAPTQRAPATQGGDQSSPALPGQGNFATFVSRFLHCGVLPS